MQTPFVVVGRQVDGGDIEFLQGVGTMGPTWGPFEKSRVLTVHGANQAVRNFYKTDTAFRDELHEPIPHYVYLTRPVTFHFAGDWSAVPKPKKKLCSATTSLLPKS